MIRKVAGDSLARNSVLIMASTVGTSGLGYLYWMMAAHRLDGTQVGAATALISAATVVSMVANLGLGHLFIQRLPESDTPGWSRLVSAGLLAGCAATLGAALLVLVAALAAGGGNFSFLAGAPGAFGLVATAVALTASTLLDYVFVAHRASHGMLLRNLALAAGKLAALAVLTTLGFRSAGAVIVAWTIPSLAVTGFTLRHSLGHLRPGARLNFTNLKSQLAYVRSALTGHHLINLAQAGPSSLLPVLVTARLGATANAHFYVAWMTASVLFMVSPAVASALYAERRHGAGRSASLPRAALVVLVVIGVPAVVLFAAGGWVLTLFSPAYAASGGPLLKLLVIAAIPDAITNLAVAHWRSQGEFRRCLHLNLLMAAACLGLTWCWLPGTGIAAAGFAWFTGQTIGAFAVLFLALRAQHRRRSDEILGAARRHRATAPPKLTAAPKPVTVAPRRTHVTHRMIVRGTPRLIPAEPRAAAAEPLEAPVVTLESCVPPIASLETAAAPAVSDVVDAEEIADHEERV